MTAPTKNESTVLWEVFLQERSGSPHTHAGSIRAADAEMALQNARDVYARRGLPESVWVVRTTDITTSSATDRESFFEPVKDKTFRHTRDYVVPRDIERLER